MKIEKFITGPIQVNTYLLYDEISNEGILIDIGGSEKEIVSRIKELNLTIKGIYNTHGHFDHILGAKEVQEALDIPFFVHQNDKILVENLESQMAMFGMSNAQPPIINGYLNKNTEILLGKNIVKIIETPGHTEGGICILTDKTLFSGDTLFLESIGRTDLPGGDYSTLKNSIREKLFTLPDDTKVYPGHDRETSIGHEKQYNFMV